MKLLVTFFLLMVALPQLHGAKILLVWNMPARSHFNLCQALAVGLAEKGHEITVISPFKVGKSLPNLKEIVLDDALKTLQGTFPVTNMFDSKSMSVVGMMKHMVFMGKAMTNYTFNHPEVQRLIKSDTKFDVFIAEVFQNEGLFGLAKQFGAISVGVSTMATTKWTNDMVGNPNNPAYHPNLFLNFTPKMSYWQRLVNTLIVMAEDLLQRYNVCGQNELFQQNLQPYNKDPLPHLNEVITNVSLVLLNTNVAVGYPRANVPNMIDVGGIHIKDGGKLPKDLQEFLDSAKDGVIYFSMGSNLQSTQLPDVKRDALLKTFGKLKQKVLWKWEDPNLPNKPDNVFIQAWMPQQSILEHPNVKVFITHGGLLSSLEAVHFGVPLVGIPIFGDQFLNMARAINAGYGVQVDYESLSEESLSAALKTVLGNPSYKTKVQELSKIFRDAPQKPLEKAIYHIEYALRHKGAPFLKAPSLHLSGIQTMLLDVAAGLLAIVGVLLAAIWLLLRFVCRKICGRKVVSVDKKKKRN